jgi:hypothetical protein
VEEGGLLLVEVTVSSGCNIDEEMEDPREIVAARDVALR